MLNAFIQSAANDSLPIVAKLADVILQRLEATIPMQTQVVSVDDRLILEDMQTSITGCLMVSFASSCSNRAINYLSLLSNVLALRLNPWLIAL